MKIVAGVLRMREELINFKPYNVRETLGWAWRNVRGIRKSNPCEVEPLPHRSVMNPVQSAMKLCFISDIMDMRSYQLAIAADVKEFIQSCG